MACSKETIEHALLKVEKEAPGPGGSCPICNKCFGKKSSLLTHIKNHAAEKKFICSYCQKGFTQAANLRNHERIHRNERPFVCLDCGKGFTQITNLNNHRRLHTGERPFVCNENNCGRSFAQVTNLNNHMKTHHKVQQYKCNKCPSRFTQLSQLNEHMASHSQLLVCPHCPEISFTQQGQLQQHLKVHGDSHFPFPCNQCEEKFLLATHLEKHKKMHAEFRYKCNMCSSSFNLEGLLKKHIQRHIDGRYFTCQVEGCTEGFTVKTQLTRHMQTHHSISNCTQRLSVKRLKMSNYVRSAATGKYNCYFESCDGSFSNEDSLNDHLRGVHGLSILKNAGKRSKMDLMLLEEQIKQQEMEQQGSSSQESTEMVGEEQEEEFHHQQIQGIPNQSQLAGYSNNEDPIALDHEEIVLQPDVQHLIDAETGAPRSSMAVESPLGCSYCFQVFNTESALQNHTMKFHANELQ